MTKRLCANGDGTVCIPTPSFASCVCTGSNGDQHRELCTTVDCRTPEALESLCTTCAGFGDFNATGSQCLYKNVLRCL